MTSYAVRVGSNLSLLMCPAFLNRNRSEIAIRAALELIPLFEAEALWPAVESSRALVGSLQDWDLESACRYLLRVESDCPPGTLLRPETTPITDRISRLAAALHSMVADLLAQKAVTVHN